jgi:hypothetical protein
MRGMAQRRRKNLIESNVHEFFFHGNEGGKEQAGTEPYGRDVPEMIFLNGLGYKSGQKGNKPCNANCCCGWWYIHSLSGPARHG